MKNQDPFSGERSHRDNDRPNFRLHQSFNCFQGDRSGTCSGDGGSPLVCPIKNSDRYMQVSVIYILCKPDHIKNGFENFPVYKKLYR